MHTDVYLFPSMTLGGGGIKKEVISVMTKRARMPRSKFLEKTQRPSSSEAAVFHMPWLAELILPFNRHFFFSHRNIEHTWNG